MKRPFEFVTSCSRLYILLIAMGFCILSLGFALCCRRVAAETTGCSVYAISQLVQMCAKRVVVSTTLQEHLYSCLAVFCASCYCCLLFQSVLLIHCVMSTPVVYV